MRHNHSRHDRLDLRDFGVVAGSGNDYTAEVRAAFYEAAKLNVACYGPSGEIIITDTLVPMCSIIGEGAPYQGAGLTFVWHGAADKVFHFSDYVSGWQFEKFRIDNRNVESDTVAMYFARGLNGACFRDVELRGRHVGPAWGGIYFDHDGILVIGGDGSTKYDMSQNRFERVFFSRLRSGLTVTDPAGQAPGNGNTFDGCFSWCNGWTVKMPGANNTLINCEFNAEAGNHAVVQSGQYAVGWVYHGCSWGTAEIGSGNQPIYADTAGSASFATILGGTIETSADGGVPNLVRDAGATGSKVLRYAAYGVNNFNSTAITVDQLDLGQNSARANQFFYGESGRLFTSWAPTFNGLNVVLNGGSVSYSGKYTLIGNVCYWSALVQPSGGATTESVAGTTFINNMPFMQKEVACTCNASNSGSLASYGVGQGAVGGDNMFTPTWPAVSNGVVISGFFFTDGAK